MFGTIDRMRVKEGMGSALDHPSKKFREPTKLLESEPEWLDGDVVRTAHIH